MPFNVSRIPERRAKGKCEAHESCRMVHAVARFVDSLGDLSGWPVCQERCFESQVLRGVRGPEGMDLRAEC
eukprot:1662594-Lingulodinium_polyedra.AAC.1